MQIFHPGADTVALLIFAAIGAFPIFGVGLAEPEATASNTVGRS